MRNSSLQNMPASCVLHNEVLFKNTMNFATIKTGITNFKMATKDRSVSCTCLRDSHQLQPTIGYMIYQMWTVSQLLHGVRVDAEVRQSQNAEDKLPSCWNSTFRDDEKDFQEDLQLPARRWVDTCTTSALHSALASYSIWLVNLRRHRMQSSDLICRKKVVSSSDLPTMCWVPASRQGSY